VLRFYLRRKKNDIPKRATSLNEKNEMLARALRALFNNLK
jgi:hypothetical protein